MAKITSRTLLNVGTELTIDESGKTFTLNAAGNLVAKDGVTMQALYSKFVELWSTATYQDSPFPFNALDALSGQFLMGVDAGGTYNGWKPADDATRQKIRDAGWKEYSSGGVLNREYVGIVGLGSVSTGAQLYYQRASVDAPTNFTFTDQANEGIQVYGDATNGNFDKRTFFKGFIREYQKKYKDSVLSDTGKTATGAYLVNLLLSNEDDLKITANDAAMTGSPYVDINVKYLSQNFSKDTDLTGTNRNYGIVIDVGTHSGVDASFSSGGSVLTTAAGGITTAGDIYVGGTLTVHEGAAKGVYPISAATATTVTITGTFPAVGSNVSFAIQRAVPVSASLAQIYTKVQYLLRQNSDIDNTGGSVTGKTADLLLNFVGDTLICGFYNPSNPNGGGNGVMIEGLSAADLNSIEFYDNTYAKRLYPYSAAGTLNSNAVLVGGGSYYRMFFTTLPGAGNDYGESGAVTVNDKDGNPITGTISSGTINFTFDYDGNTQGTRTAGTDAAVTLVAGRPGSAKPVVATGTITRSKSVSLSLVAEQDRAYL